MTSSMMTGTNRRPGQGDQQIYGTVLTSLFVPSVAIYMLRPLFKIKHYLNGLSASLLGFICSEIHNLNEIFEKMDIIFECR